ncbi:unnamed protein product [marine sediment metagenome]|uniref:Uncharacterized protein n=1 Tax=marine sediment metagenome TaxID=412755 RepID=X0UWJ8_9ZZZZ
MEHLLRYLLKAFYKMGEIMNSNIFNNLFILFVLAMVAIGIGVTMNWIERRIKLIINKWLNKRASRKRVIYNLNLINKKMK